MSLPPSTPALHIELKSASRWPTGLRLLLGLCLLPLPWLLPRVWGLLALLAGVVLLVWSERRSRKILRPHSLRLMVDDSDQAAGSPVVQVVVLGRALFLRSRTSRLTLWPDQLSLAQAAQLRAWLKARGAPSSPRMQLQ